MKRWSVAEKTFRPPYYHRNCMAEFMGLILGKVWSLCDTISRGTPRFIYYDPVFAVWGPEGNIPVLICSLIFSVWGERGRLLPRGCNPALYDDPPWTGCTMLWWLDQQVHRSYGQRYQLQSWSEHISRNILSQIWSILSAQGAGSDESGLGNSSLHVWNLPPAGCYQGLARPRTS